MLNKLPTFILGSEFDKDKIDIDFVSKELNEKVTDAFDYRYRIPEGDLLLTEFNGELHQVIYQTQKQFFLSRIIKRRMLMKSYLQGRAWKKMVNNDYGITCHSEDGKYYCLYSRLFDFNTFGTMEFLNNTHK